MNRYKQILRIMAGMLLISSCTQSSTPSTVDEELQTRIKAFNLSALGNPDIESSEEMIDLGRALFFDKILSGNRDVSCSTCHLPSNATTDGLNVAIGTGGEGLGPDRSGERFSRNSQDLFNRGYSKLVTTMYTDKRINGTPTLGFHSPAGKQLPDGLNHVLAVQALFPITSRSEMRGQIGDTDIFGDNNELADLDDEDFTGIWQAIMDRLLANDEYVALFNAAFPDVDTSEFGIQHMGNALAAFEADAFHFANSPWDRYLSGESDALTTEEKSGANLFFGKANCVTCHNGNLLFDQNQDNILVPNVGPGKDDDGLDLGIAINTENSGDTFAFRSAPLRNVELTAPYMHNGAFSSLEEVVNHYNDVSQSLTSYTGINLPDDLEVHNDEEVQTKMFATKSGDTPKLNLTDNEISQIVSFLKALTDPAARDLSDIAPDEVPSGLNIDQ